LQTTQDLVQQFEERIIQVDSPAEKINLMSNLAWQLRIRDPEKAYSFGIKSLELAQTLDLTEQPYPQGLASSLVVLSFLDGEAGKLDTAMSRSLGALSYIQDQSHPEILIDAWYTLGWAYYYSGNYPASLEFGLKALKLARERGPLEKEGWCLDLVASTYKDPEQMLELHEKAYEIFERLESIEGQSRVLNNWSYTLMELKEYAPALEKARKSHQLAREHGMHMDVINIAATIGEIFTRMGDYANAYEKLNEATLLFDQYGRDISSVYILVDLGQLYLKQNDLDRAEEQLLKALEASNQMEMVNEQVRCHQYLSEIFERRGIFDQALKHYKVFNELRERTAGEGALKQLAALKVSHQIDNAQRDAEIQRLQKEKLQSELEEHKRIHSILEELATRDPLTNLFNRRHFLGLAEQEWRRSLRYDHPLCVLMMDVDRFKQINDRYGHAIGDKALIAVAGIFQSILRSTEIAGRFGGDEFVILLPETTSQNGLQVAERISQTIKTQTIQSDLGAVELTSSIGVACIMGKRTTVKSLNELLNHADKALYEAKKAGNGRTRLYKEQE
jgi:diguanylate cyclase (GGDEF)-like protein